MKQPNVFDGRAYCVQINHEFRSINSRKNIAKAMPYERAYVGRIEGMDGLYIIVDTKENEEIDRYPIPFIEKRYRDHRGELTLRVNDLILATKGEAIKYYRPYMLYLMRGKPAILKEYSNGCVFHTEGRMFKTTSRSEMGVLLPDISSHGREVIAFNDKRYISVNTQNAISNAAKAIQVRPMVDRNIHEHIR